MGASDDEMLPWLGALGGGGGGWGGVGVSCVVWFT